MRHSNLSNGSQSPPIAPSPNEVRSALEHILASSDLQASEKRREFLRFIVEETLSGRAAGLKGYSIAVAVFGRDESFDPQTDAVVRVAARRLRRDLDSYYMNAGDENSLRITIPKGAYIPHFEKLESRDGRLASGGNGQSPPANSDEPYPDDSTAADRLQRRPGAKRKYIAAAFAAVILIALSVWRLATDTSAEIPDPEVVEPAVLVLPFEALGPTDNTHYLASGISQELILDLMRFPGIRLYAPGTRQEAKSVSGPHDPNPAPATYVVSGTVFEDNATAYVTAKMVFAADDRVLWSQSYDRPLDPLALIGLQRDLAGAIATALGQPYGYMQSDLQARVGTPAVSSMQSYLCVLRAFQYRRSFQREQFEPIVSCLESAVEADPDYSDAWAMLGWLHLDAGRYEFYGAERIPAEYDRALEAASHAVRLEPNNTLALKALSSIEHYRGHFGESERLARKAAELNPNDPDTLAQLGWRLAIRGNFEEGIPILKKAIERTVNPPGWYFHLVAVERLMNGDYEEMLAIARRATNDDSAVSYALIAIASAALGDGTGARQALNQMRRFGPITRDPDAYFRRHGATDPIATALVSGLRNAERVVATSPG